MGGVWPARNPPGDPYADPRHVRLEDAWALHVERSGSDAVEWGSFLSLVERLRVLSGRLVSGETDVTWSEIVHVGRRLGISEVSGVDPRGIPSTDRVAGVSDFCRVAADVCPGIGNEAPDRFLGPWVDVLDVRRPAHRSVLRACLTHACVEPGEHDEYGRSPFAQWKRRRPLPSVEFRARMHAVAEAPLMVYRIDGRRDDRLVLSEQIQVGPRWRVDGPVRVVEVGAIGESGAIGDTLVARVIRGPEGLEAVGAWSLPGACSIGFLRSHVRLELMWMRLERRDPTVEDLLRRRGHVLTRRAHEWAWSVSLRDRASIAAPFRPVVG